MSGVCMAAGALCLLYYLGIILYSGLTADFAGIWLAAALGLSGLGLGMRYAKVHPGFFPGWMKWVVLVIIAAGCVLFFAICSMVVKGMFWKGSDGLDYVVILGAQVKKEVPSRALRRRLEKALEYAQRNPDTILILSGGQGDGEDISEAECMRRYLTEHGIAGERLVLEEYSTNTLENLKFSNELTGCAKAGTGILSNNFHVYRAVRLAKKQGYQDVEGIAARSDLLMQPHYIVREVFALIKEKLKGNI